jgi:flagellar assembly factor FliW
VDVATTRFGRVTLDPRDRVDFPKGLIGLPRIKRFATILDPSTPGLLWLQSLRDPALAMAIVPPRTIIRQYQVRTTLEQLGPIRLSEKRDVEIYVVLNQTVQCLIVNLRAPILINTRNRLGMQLPMTDSRYSLRHVIRPKIVTRKSA